MAKNSKSKVSLGDVARAANVSTTSAGCAIRNLPGVSDATRRRVMQVAKRLKYFPDARLAVAMTGIRRSIEKELLPIVWLNACREKDAWTRFKFLSPYREGASERLRELGYRIEEIWLRDPNYPMRRISQIVESQGIEGVIITDPAKHLRLNWQRLAAVAIGGGLLVPALHRVGMDSNWNLMLSLKKLKRHGYERIGVYLSEEADRLSRHGSKSTALFFNSTIPRLNRVEPLFTPYTMGPDVEQNLLFKWLKKQRPDAVVGHSAELVQRIEMTGLRVPQDIGVVHIAIEDDVLEWAGIYANKREVGRLAAAKLVSLIQQRQFGIPRVASNEFVQGEWRNGRTLLIPKP